MHRLAIRSAAAACAVTLLAGVPLWGAAAKPVHLLQSARKPGAVDRVSLQLEVGGELKQKEPLAGKPTAKTASQPISGVGHLEYDEKTLEVPGGRAGRWRSVRCYHKAAAVIKFDNEGRKPALRPGRSLIAVEVTGHSATLFSPQGPLSRDELDMVDLLGNSLLLDQLLPEKPVPVGHSWKLSPALLALFLGLDTVTSGEVESTLKEVTDTLARFELGGRVKGKVHEVSTEIELKARYRYDRRLKRIDWIGLLVKESRGISEAEAGFDFVVRLQLRVLPKESSPELSDAALQQLPLEPTSELLRLACEPADGGWAVTYDRRWHLTAAHDDLVVLKLIDRGEFVAQCHISPLPKRPPEKLISLEEFQEQIRRALGKGLGEFVQASQSVDPCEHRIYRVVAQGQQAEVAIQWNYYHVADPQGRQAVLAFIFRQTLAERLAQADEALVQAVRFFEPKTAK